MSPVRLVVADVDADGRSTVRSDAPAARVCDSPDWPGAGVTLLWRSPGMVELEDDPRASLDPPSGGSTFMIWSRPPEAELARMDPERRARAQRPRISTVGPSTADDRPGMHATATLDYVIVISGELTLLLDDGEVTLRPGDTLVGRGVRHRWENRGNEPAICATVNVDAPGWADGRRTMSDALGTHGQSDQREIENRS